MSRQASRPATTAWDSRPEPDRHQPARWDSAYPSRLKPWALKVALYVPDGRRNLLRPSRADTLPAAPNRAQSDLPWKARLEPLGDVPE